MTGYLWAVRCGSGAAHVLRDARLTEAYFSEVYRLFLKRLSGLKGKEKMSEGEAESLKQIFNVLLEAKRLKDNE